MVQVALFTGGIQPLPTSGRPTGMFKAPVAGPVELTVEGFVGDQQADRRVHGGPDKAVHLYPARHYVSLANSFPEIAAALVPGALGENLSAADIDERDVRIGDIWQLGGARLQVSQPRSPCWKIDERLVPARHASRHGQPRKHLRAASTSIRRAHAIRRHAAVGGAPAVDRGA